MKKICLFIAFLFVAMLASAQVLLSEKGNVYVADSSNFHLVIGQKRVAVMFFYAPWCGPCKRAAPQLDHFASTHPNVVVGKVDCDRNEYLVKEYGIVSVPTYVFFNYGRVTAMVSVALSSIGIAEQVELIDSQLFLDQ